MKKIFQIIGIASFAFFGFYITEQTAIVVKEQDAIMYQIKKDENKYNTESINATIEDKTIVPGIYGKQVNINKSYKKMKSMGLYDDSLYVYNDIKPEISVNDYIDHYITNGNPKKQMVSLLFIVNQEKISDIINVIGDTKVNFVVNRYWLEDNTTLSKELIKLGHNLLLSTSIINKDLINNLDQQVYCYNPKQDNNFLDSCVKNDWLTISPNIEISNNPLLEVKNKILSGSIIVFNINKQVIKELPNIIEYINSKGFTITNINEHLSEYVNN